MSTHEQSLPLFHRYSAILGESLRQGLTKSDLRKMRKQNPFRFETHQSLKLEKTLQQLLTVEKQILEAQPNRRTASKLVRNILKNLIGKPSRVWNPGILDQPCQLPGLASYAPDDHELILYVIPSPYGFDWSSPFRLLMSLRNYLTIGKRHYIGHMVIELRRKGKTEALTGQTGETNLQVIKSFFTRSIGLQFLFSTFPGRLECHKAVYNDLLLHSRDRRIAFIRKKLASEQYLNLSQFLDEWCERGHYQRYGLVHLPKAHKGASCTSFAIHFLEECARSQNDRHLKNLWLHWTRQVLIPQKLIGVGPLRFLARIIFGAYLRRWAREYEEHSSLRFLDPDLVFEWVTKNSTENFGVTGKGLKL